MRVILNWLPPAEPCTVSAAMSILQSFLTTNGVDTETKYWNVLFANTEPLTNFQMEDKDALYLLPFLSYIALKYNDKQAVENIEHKLRRSNPQYINISKTYYTDLIANLSNLVSHVFMSELNKIEIEKCTLFGISTKFDQWIPGNILAELAKEINPNIKIVIGGFGTEKEAVALMQNFDVYDYAVWGEGEYALLGLCRHLENPAENPLSEVQHLVYKENDILKTTQIKSKYVDLNNVNPDFSSYFNQQNNKNIANLYVPIEGSRGCHWRKCKFCFLNSGYKSRGRDVHKIAAFIKAVIEEYKATDFCFIDNDWVNNDLTSFEKLLDLLIDLRQEYPAFSIQNAEIISKGINAEIIKKMSFAGVKSAQVGYEALNDSLLRKINKKNSLSSNILFIKWAKQFNIKIAGANVITNLIGETDTEIIDSIKNLHFLRFYLDKNFFLHRVIPLAITSSSQYYKYLENDNLLEKWNYNGLAKLLPQSYINDKTNRFDIFCFLKETTDPLWNDFNVVEKYYLDNSYYYQIIEKDAKTYLYQEYYNSNLIKQLELEKDALYWKILYFCNRKVASKQDIIECFNNDSQEVEETIKELFDEYLLYANDDLSEIISLINTDLIHY